MNSPSISTTTIPQEIVDNIIDELFYIHGKKSLSKMAIASRSCLHRARSHLFNTLVLASRSACPLANLRELNMLRCLLRGIPSIKPYLRVLAFRHLFLSVDSDISPSSVVCDAHANPTQYHTITPELRKDYNQQIVECLYSIPALLGPVSSVQINCHPRAWTLDWEDLPTPLARHPIAPFCVLPSLTSLALKSIEKFPTSLLWSMLSSNKLNLLVLDAITLKCDDNKSKGEGQYHLSSLRTFACRRASGGDVDMTVVASLIIGAAPLQKLRYLGPLDRTSGTVSLQRLTDLRELSVAAPDYRFTLKRLLLQLTESTSSLEVLELFEMEEYNMDLSLNSAKHEWKEMDEILTHGAFSRLQTIRLVFDMPEETDTLTDYERSVIGRYYSSVEIASIFDSSLMHTVARGVKIICSDGHIGASFGLL